MGSVCLTSSHQTLHKTAVSISPIADVLMGCCHASHMPLNTDSQYRLLDNRSSQASLYPAAAFGEKVISSVSKIYGTAVRADLFQDVLSVGMDVEPSIRDGLRHDWCDLPSLLLEGNGEIVSHKALLPDDGRLHIDPHDRMADIGYLHKRNEA